ncbi:hypothetical protein PGT21_019091 [Puccinia graminis f. sp. tritici]|uniref:Uncharacterized protein n=1 Tax=Puccinia graminis f. sp. tritici TaxID=56615 RepID=A0A5B0N7N6_PUCGR|nr:hypothetical protein PGT21_019091 [Puccinia graminis f. sp. tritici]
MDPLGLENLYSLKADKTQPSSMLAGRNSAPVIGMISSDALHDRTQQAAFSIV